MTVTTPTERKYEFKRGGRITPAWVSAWARKECNRPTGYAPGHLREPDPPIVNFQETR